MKKKKSSARLLLAMLLVAAQIAFMFPWGSDRSASSGRGGFCKQAVSGLEQLQSPGVPYRQLDHGGSY
ncbi:Uncharacterised protein [Actinobacillus pleuropneumoniae]|nr:Uncharacterised protein [Actinobacillus pleuropneumoniae]